MSKEELPMIIPEKKMAIKRQKQRNIEGIKRVGKVVGSFGLAALGVGALGLGGPIAVVGAGAYVIAGTNAIKNIIFKSAGKNSMFVTKRKLNGELEIDQDSTKLKQAQKIKALQPQEKAAMMGLGMLVSLRNIQQMYEDKDIQTEPAQNGENNVYPQVFSTVTHGDNIKTLEALEKLGYIQIDRKEFKKKSTFAWERLGFGEYKSAQKAFLAQFNPEERKGYEHDFYDMAIQITDKKLNVDELAQRYVNVDQIDKSDRQERKALKTIGLIFKALKNSKIDISMNELGEAQIKYDSEEPLLKRVQRENLDKCEEYRKTMYVGNEIEQTQVQEKCQNEITQENVTENQQNKDEEIEH
jgi:hypothetical protein